MNVRAAIFALMLCASAPAVALAQPQPDSLGAGWREQQDEAQRCVRDGRCVSLAQVIQTIRRRTPGRQLDAGLEPGPGGRPVYRVRWAADDGRRIDYLVDVQSGAIIRGD
jgi:uncharacterized membrane protein YkoI